MKLSKITLLLVSSLLIFSNVSANTNNKSFKLGCCMEVDISRNIDASEKDKNGNYDYYYEYDIYTFKDKNITLIARSYTDEAEEIHFLRTIQNEKPRGVSKTDLERPFFNEILEYLKSVNKKKINWLSSRGYVPVE